MKKLIIKIIFHGKKILFYTPHQHIRKYFERFALKPAVADSAGHNCVQALKIREQYAACALIHKN